MAAKPTTFVQLHCMTMSHSRLMEVARLRSIIQRLLREHGNAETLAILRQAIETELIRDAQPL